MRARRLICWAGGMLLWYAGVRFHGWLYDWQIQPLIALVGLQTLLLGLLAWYETNRNRGG